MTTLPRLIESMPARDYHAHPAISKSGLDRIAKSPMHYAWEYLEGNRKTDTEALALGRAFHTLLLEPELFDAEVAVSPKFDRRTKQGKADAEEFDIAAAGRTVIDRAQHGELTEMAAAIAAHPAARIVLEGKGRVEPSLFWTDADHGVDCRARFDWLRDDGLIVDLKTTRSAHPDDWPRLAHDHRYHVQAAFYMEAYRRVTGKEPAGFAFIAVEKVAPYGVSATFASPGFLDAGRLLWERDLETYARCLKANHWPGYPETLEPLNLPSWAQYRIEQGTYA